MRKEEEDMKVMKRISAVLLSLCLVVPCFSMIAEAAGRISFADPTTAVGEYVEVKCAVRTEGETLGNIDLELTYDESYLRFKSGESVEESGDGTLTYSTTGSSTEVIFYIEFQALQEGTTKIELASASVADSSDAEISVSQGYSTVTIEEGDPSKIEEESDDEGGNENLADASDIEVDVNGTVYTLTDEFADADIPNGYTRTQRNLDGEDRQMVENESGSVCLGYLRDADMVGDFFLYNEETATFSPYAEISISDSTSIIVLSDASQVSLPDSYSEAKLSLNEKEFPVWQDTENEGMYVFYAMNNSGEIGYYQYDSVEGTYQRFQPEAAEEVVEEKEDNSFLGKVQAFVEKNISIMILVVGLGGMIGLILLIVLAVKLHNRNVELDEYYDKYGIDEEDAEEEVEDFEEEKEVKEDKKKSFFRKKAEVEEEFEEADFEEEFEEAGFEEEFEEVAFEETEFEELSLEDEFEDFREIEMEEAAEEEEFTGYTERMDFTIDDLDELLGETKVQKRGHIEDDDTFKVDFIDLD